MLPNIYIYEYKYIYIYKNINIRIPVLCLLQFFEASVNLSVGWVTIKPTELL